MAGWLASVLQAASTQYTFNTVGGLLLFLSYTLTRRLYFAETGLVIEPWRVPY